MKTYTKDERKELDRLTGMLKAIDPFKAAHVDRILQIDGSWNALFPPTMKTSWRKSGASERRCCSRYKFLAARNR